MSCRLRRRSSKRSSINKTSWTRRSPRLTLEMERIRSLFRACIRFNTWPHQPSFKTKFHLYIISIHHSFPVMRFLPQWSTKHLRQERHWAQILAGTSKSIYITSFDFTWQDSRAQSNMHAFCMNIAIVWSQLSHWDLCLNLMLLPWLHHQRILSQQFLGIWNSYEYMGGFCTMHCSV